MSIYVNIEKLLDCQTVYTIINKGFHNKSGIGDGVNGVHSIMS